MEFPITRSISGKVERGFGGLYRVAQKIGKDGG